MIDLHSHVLPGLDDGARSLDEAVELARQAAAGGVTILAATPHVRDDYPTTPEQMEHGVGELRDELARVDVDIEIVPGGELALARLGTLTPDEVRRFTLGQAGKYALLECPYFGSPLELIPAIRALREGGMTSIIAHPERNPDVAQRPGRLTSLVELGALVQVTASSVEGTLGRSPRETSLKLFDLQLAHLIASDAHGPHIRESGLAGAAEAVGEGGLAQYLTEIAPAAILAGESVSAPPRRRQRRRFLLF